MVLDADATRFDGDPVPPSPELLSVVSADMDLDGDPDVIFNRHLLYPLEIFENTGDGFAQINRVDSDLSGVWDNSGIANLFAEEEDMEVRIDAFGQPGVYVWHEVGRDGRWFIRVVGDGLLLQIRVNQPLLGIEGVPDEAVDVLSPFEVDVTVPSDGAFSLGNHLIGTQLHVTAIGVPPPTIYVGPTLAVETSGVVSLWKPDPHGMAWVDRVGSAEPELFVTRGGLQGKLVPPHDPKTDQLFEWLPETAAFQEVESGVIPPDYCRGRQVAWVDVDADGVDELSVGCTDTPNVLLDDVGDGTFVDRAPELGLDRVVLDAHAWLDLDGDGWLDVVYLHANQLYVMRRDGDSFADLAGSELGLALAEIVEEVPDGLFDPATLQVFDIDRDGDLDLFASSVGEGEGAALFTNEDGAFTDQTEAWGLGEADGFGASVPVDFDNDGRMDVVAVSTGGLVLWWNTGAALNPLDMGVAFEAAVAIDADGDGRVDVVSTTSEDRWVLFNRSRNTGVAVMVDVRAPLGTVVRGYYEDGSVQAQQWGSAMTSRYSQGVLPLRFGVFDVGLRSLTLQLPGEAEERPPVGVGDLRSVTLEGR